LYDIENNEKFKYLVSLAIFYGKIGLW